MLYTIIAGFAIAAILGMVLITHVLSNKTPPRGVLVFHGLFAGTGILLLLIYMNGNAPGPMEAAILFVVAALGGFIMLARDLRNKPIPKWLAVAHGLLAATAFTFLLIFAFGK